MQHFHHFHLFIARPEASSSGTREREGGRGSQRSRTEERGGALSGRRGRGYRSGQEEGLNGVEV